MKTKVMSRVSQFISHFKILSLCQLFPVLEADIWQHILE